MTDTATRLSRADRKIVDSARERLPEIAEENCSEWENGACRKTGEPCGFPTCPLVDRIANES